MSFGVSMGPQNNFISQQSNMTFCKAIWSQFMTLQYWGQFGNGFDTIMTNIPILSQSVTWTMKFYSYFFRHVSSLHLKVFLPLTD